MTTTDQCRVINHAALILRQHGYNALVAAMINAIGEISGSASTPTPRAFVDKAEAKRLAILQAREHKRIVAENIAAGKARKAGA